MNANANANTTTDANANANAQAGAGVAGAGATTRLQTAMRLSQAQSGRTVEWMTITPELAMGWLEDTNTNNRAVRDIHVRRLAEDMKAGKWRGFNGEAIRFDSEGRLVDGQHRLWACTIAGVPFDTLVVAGVDPEEYATIGTGIRKTFADFLGPMHGEKNANLYAAAVRLVYSWQAGELGANRWDAPSVSVLEQTYHDHPGLRDSVTFAAGHRSLLNQSFVALIHYAATISGKRDRAETFLTRLHDGLGLTDTDPVYHLRKFLAAQHGSRRKAHTGYVLAMAIKAWKAADPGRQIRALRFRADEAFPELEGK